MTTSIKARSLHPGTAAGRVIRLGEPLSFWGGLDPSTGTIIDRRHPQQGLVVAGAVVVMPSGRGSSSSSSVLAEAVRLGTAPAAVVLRETDGIIALGALVAAELYGRRMPLVLVAGTDFDALRDGDRVLVSAGNGEATIELEGA